MSTPRGARASGAVPIWEDHADIDTRHVSSPIDEIKHFENTENDPGNLDSDAQTDEEDVADSIEGPNYRWKISFARKQYPKEENRNVSTATAFHLGEDEDPFKEEEHEDDEDEGDIDGDIGDEDEEHDEFGEEERERDIEDSFIPQDDDEDELESQDDAQSARRSYRAVSDLSSMPDDADLPQPTRRGLSSRVGTPTTIYTPHSQSRRPQYPRSRLLSTPTRAGGSVRHFSPEPTGQQDRYVSSPLAQRNSGFRNPSSVRAIQLSSPSPPPGVSPRFAPSPRSARHRRLEREDLSRSATPAQSANPKKEYPLILLHCSFTLFLPPYPAAVLDAVLPAWIQQNLALLHDKVTPTVVERGILLPHPGEDYELLEERILESLELKRPRVGKCGHFLGPDADDETPGHEDVDGFDSAHHAHASCADCERSIASDHRGAPGDAPHRRWDIRVYAANGLMRAGAWSAAWREMEKVDLEIGVWIPDEIRKQLDAEASKRREGASRGAQESPYRFQGPPRERYQAMPLAPTPPRAQQVRTDVDASASMAACSKPGKAPRGERRQRMRAAEDEVPLSTLLGNYLRRKLDLTLNKDMALQALVVVLAAFVLRQWYLATPTAVPIAAHFDLAAVENVSMQDVPSSVAQGELQRETSLPVQVEHAPATSKIPACTFPPSEAGKAGMTALPADLAALVLGAASSPGLETITVTGDAPEAAESIVVLGQSDDGIENVVPVENESDGEPEVSVDPNRGSLASAMGDLLAEDVLVEP